MRKKLSELAINEVSVVDKGASPHAHIRFFKRNDEVEAFRKAFPRLTAGADDAEVAERIQATVVKDAALTDDEVRASLLAQLVQVSDSMKDGPRWLADFSVAVHRHLETAKAKQRRDRATLAGQVQEPASPSIAKHGNAGAAHDADVLRASLAFQEKAKQAGQGAKPAPASATAGAMTDALADRMAKANAPRPAAELLEHRAKMLKAASASAGRIMTSAQAYTAVLTNPEHAALAKQVREEEQTAASVRH